MDADLSFDACSDCSSEVSETRSELEARIYSIIHHNDFSGTTAAPSIDPKYGVEFTANGEVVVFLNDRPPPPPPSPPPVVELVLVNDSPVAEASPKVRAINLGVIPTIVLSDDEVQNAKDTTSCVAVDGEFAETSLKKKRKRKKKNKTASAADVPATSIEEYISIVKATDALKQYKKDSGLDKMVPGGSKTGRVSLNVAFHNERAEPMTPNEILKQYRIGKRTGSSLWYRCPKTWTPDMVKYYTKIQKSKRNFDCREELNKIRDKYGSTPMDWTLDPMDKIRTSTPKVKCHSCKQFGHFANNCDKQYKPEVCIMCGMEGHNFHSCNKKLCLSCGTSQNKFTNNCHVCVSMSRIRCSMCNTVGHESNYCSESWRQFHNTTSTEPEPEYNEFAQSTYRSNVEETSRSTPRKSGTSSTFSTPNDRQINKTTPKTDNSSKSKKLKRLRNKKRFSKTKNHSNLTVSDNESINIDVNIQDVTFKRTLTKKNFFKNKKIKC